MRESAAFDPQVFRAALLAEMERQLPQAALSLSPEEKERQASYLCFLADRSRFLNLTAVTEPSAMVRLHLLDSLSLLPVLDQEMKRQGKNGEGLCCLDLGSGAGLPGIPLKIVRPAIDLCLLDALGKRVRFMAEAAAAAGISEGIEAIHARAEEAGREAGRREAFQLVTARAVAELRILAELALPLTAVSGLFCAMKGRAEDEIRAGKRALSLLGGRIEEERRFTLPGGEERTLLLVRKLHATPAAYPRPFAKIKKQPL